MRRYVPDHEPFPLRFRGFKDPYRALIRAVVYQQLSVKAAATIYGRLMALFGARHPEPSDILRASDAVLRGAGLSRQKIAAIRDIAQKRLDGAIPHSRSMNRLSDDQIIARLTEVRGVGRWTVEMYLMFSLGRPDVLPVDDLGVRRGAERMLGRSLTPRELAQYGERWAPWRSAAAWHCWRAADSALMES